MVRETKNIDKKNKQIQYRIIESFTKEGTILNFMMIIL